MVSFKTLVEGAIFFIVVFLAALTPWLVTAAFVNW